MALLKNALKLGVVIFVVALFWNAHSIHATVYTGPTGIIYSDFNDGGLAPGGFKDIFVDCSVNNSDVNINSIKDGSILGGAHGCDARYDNFWMQDNMAVNGNNRDEQIADGHYCIYVHGGDSTICTHGEFDIIGGALRQLPDIISGNITSDTTWTLANSPYVVDHVIINSGVTLNIDPGVIVKFLNTPSDLNVFGTLNAGGTEENKIYFTSFFDDSAGGDTNDDGDVTTGAPGDWRYILFHAGSTGNFTHSIVRYGGSVPFSSSAPSVGIFNSQSSISISDSIISDNNFYGIYQDGGTLNVTRTEIKNHIEGISTTGGIHNIIITESFIYNNRDYGIYNGNTTTVLNAENNFWGNPTGPFHTTQNSNGLGDRVSNNVSFIPWAGVYPVPPPCSTDCFSNVLFLPGLMGSRLYEQKNSIEKELWVSRDDPDHADLSLNEDGKSINEIYTKDDTQKLDGDGDETGIIDDVYSANIYQSFISDLKKWKDDEKIIEDYAFIPYDWRLSLQDIITNGATDNDNLSYDRIQDFSESFILKKLEELQTSSRTGKVTIIAHSNGGLVAKALMQKLKDTNNPLYGKIDKIIFVAVPQVGTPDATVALLHGTELGHGFIMDKDRSRQLAENMSTVYNLLPSAGYFTTVDPAFAVDKIASFQDIPFFGPQISRYGVYVSNETELKNYVLGTDGRVKPTFSDTIHPNIGNSTLYVQAENVHQILDSWQPSPNTKVIQVAGWGEETIAGLDYTSIKDVTEHISYKPRFVVDGDGTVVVPSALWMSNTNQNVERWWVNLDAFNGNDVFREQHRNILEIPNLRNFIKSKINESTFNDTDNIVLDSNSNLQSNKTRLHFTLHSPLTLGVEMGGKYTGQDPVTGEIREEIPSVTYRQIGEVKFISAPNDIGYTVKLQGYAQGYFSLDMDKQEGNNITEFTSFEGIPSSTSTEVTMDVVPNQSISNTVLKVNTDGNETIDFDLPAKLNGVVTMPKYIFPGFLQPINDTAHQVDQNKSVFKAGSTVPVKFQLKNLDSTITQTTSAPIWLNPERGNQMNALVDEPIYTILGTSGNTFKWDPIAQQYIYNWSTKGLKSGYWYNISVELDDGYVYSVTIGLR